MDQERELAEIVDELRRTGRDGQHVEAKKAAWAVPKNLRKTLSAFSNTNKGLVVLGLDEAAGFDAVGVKDVAAMTAQIANICSNEMVPPIRPPIESHKFEGVDLITFEVPEMNFKRKPSYVKASGITTGSYTRVGDSDRRLTPYEVQLLIEGRGQPDHDGQPVPESSLDDLDRDLLSAYFAHIAETRKKLANLDEDARLQAARIVVGKERKVSLAALLAFGRHPQAHYPQLNLTFVRYINDEGSTEEDGKRFLDNVALDGPIPHIVSDLEGPLHRNMARGATVVGMWRHDTWEYPKKAIREAVVNGLVHRDLSPQSRGAQVQVEIYPSRLVVRSPGGLHGPVTVERLGEGVLSSRNAVLHRLLEDTPILGESAAVCENRGSGIKTILGELRREGMDPPRFVDDVGSFTVEFSNRALLSDDVVSWINSLGQDRLTDSQIIGLALLRRSGTLDNAGYRAATGVDSRVATTELGDLVDRGVAVQHGVKRWTHYSLTNPAEARSAPTRITVEARRRKPADRRVEILEALGAETLSRADIAKKTGLTDRNVRHWLKTLRDEGEVERTTDKTQSIDARYRAVRSPGQGTLFDEAAD